MDNRTRYSKKRHKPAGPYVKKAEKYLGGGFVSGLASGLLGATAANAARAKRADAADATDAKQKAADTAQDTAQDAEEDE